VTGDQAVETLRQALQLSPENVPLRRHLAESLLSLGRPEEAEAEFRAALALAPEDQDLKVGLANAFVQQTKNTHALVILEDLTKRSDAPAKAFVLFARLLARAGDVREAVAMYRRAVDADPSVADVELAQRLGIRDREREPHTISGEPDPERDTDEYDATPDEVVEGRVRASWEGPPPADLGVEVERPKLKFADVGGMDPLKDEIRMKIIHPLEHPDLYKAYGKPVGGGILLYGPPGCGKTYLARATAGEIQAGFLAVGINDVLEMWIGNSERNLHALFERARGNTPCVLFFDEVDALAASRADLRASGGRQLINQFLAELDGLGGPNEGVLVLAATNAPWHLDPAFRRPGRFDRILFVPPPDVHARAAILQLHARGKPVQDVDYDHVAKKTGMFSGADLKAIVDVAVEAKLREAIQAGAPQPLTTKDLLSAAGSVKPSTREWFSTARNYALYSNQGGVYDDILKYLKIG
jgi:AAA+ superfamily predicted ATPase